MREKKKNKQLAHRKVVARQIAKKYLGSIRENALGKLKDIGYFTNRFQVDILDNDVVPWLYEEAFKHIQELTVQQAIPNNLMLDHFIVEETQHNSTVERERQRKQLVADEEARQQSIKMEEKRLRREAREAKKRAAELARLKEEIKDTFIADGSSILDVGI